MANVGEIRTDELIQKIPESGKVKAAWLRANLKLGSGNLTTWKSRGLKPDENKLWDLRGVCQFIIKGGKGQDREDRKAAAVEIMKHLNGGAKESTPKVLYFENMEEGLEGALSRVRQLEKHMSIQAQDFSNDPILLANHLKALKDVQDLLRKHEAESLTILERQKSLIPKEEVHNFFNSKITPTVANLRAIPDQVIDHIMEQDDRTLVLEKLEKAIDKALEGIAGK
jgi:DNA repair ATPase RecN